MAKERDTVILSVRIKKDLLAQMENWLRTKKGKKFSRNAFVVSAIQERLRKHERKEA